MCRVFSQNRGILFVGNTLYLKEEAYTFLTILFCIWTDQENMARKVLIQMSGVYS